MEGSRNSQRPPRAKGRLGTSQTLASYTLFPENYGLPHRPKTRVIGDQGLLIAAYSSFAYAGCYPLGDRVCSSEPSATIRAPNRTSGRCRHGTALMVASSRYRRALALVVLPDSRPP